MMPVVPTAKRSHGFTIDSLMSKDTRPRSRSRSPPAPLPLPPPPSSRLRPPSTSPDPPSSSSSSTPVNLTASAEAATVPMREGILFGSPGNHHTSSFHPLHNNALLLNSMKGLYNCGPGGDHTAAYPDSLTAAAALGFPVPMGASPAAPHGLPAGFSPGHPGLGAAHPLLLGAAAGHREHFSLYPWLMSRHGGYFAHGRFPGHDAGLLLQPFRKPKRIRTAFSPSQLLRLEHAFEKNHYVVGQERKDLAVNLSLTETQVKVWFQNRRTKYKRMKAEEAENHRGDGSGHSKDPGSPGGASVRSDGDDKPLDISSNPEEEEDEELEMELIDDDEEDEIDCVTPDEEVNLVRKSLALEHQKQLLEQQHHQQQIGGQGHVHQYQGQNHHHLQLEQSRSSRSPSPTAAKTAHHVERWRNETSQVQVV